MTTKHLAELHTAIETHKLTLRPLSTADAPSLYALFSDEETLRYWNGYPHRDPVDTAGLIKRILERENGRYWAICEKKSDRAIGYVGFTGNTGPPAVAYIIHRNHWGKGYGREALRAAVGYGFNSLKLDRIELWIHPDNLASIKVAEKVGFTYRGRRRTRFVNAAVAHDLFIYGLRASEWLHVAGALSAPADQHFYGLRPILPVVDLQKTLDFYCHKLDFVIDYTRGLPPVMAVISQGEWSSEAARIHFAASQEPINPSGWLTIIVGPDIDGLCNKFRGRDVQIVSEPAARSTGGSAFEIRDCNGYILNFWTP